jgi:hypothetical protein
MLLFVCFKLQIRVGLEMSLLFPSCGRFFKTTQSLISIRILPNSRRGTSNTFSRRYHSTFEKECANIRCHKLENNGRLSRKKPTYTPIFRIFHTGKSIQTAIHSSKAGSKLKIPVSARMELQRLMGLAKTEKWTLTGI